MRIRQFATLTTIAGFLTIALAATEAEAGSINLATGLDASGSLQSANDSIDAFWKAAGGVNPIHLPNAYVVGPGSADDGTCCGWPANGPNSAWIAVNPDDVNGNGLMSFTRTFWVNTPGTASISGGLWSIDDNGTLVLNGDLLSTLHNGYGSLNAFGTGAGDFVHGWNTLTMTVIAPTDDFYEAARLEGMVIGAGVPEPSTWAMMILGFAGLGFAGYRRGAKVRPAIA